MKIIGSSIRQACFLWLFVGMAVCAKPVAADEIPAVPVPGMVTLLDLGAKKCIPCKMMAPILEKMEKAYEGRAAVVFIDVWQNRSQAARFGVRGIPTQIFFDEKGGEVYRHVGFMDESSIVSQLEKMGVEKAGIKKAGAEKQEGQKAAADSVQAASAAQR